MYNNIGGSSLKEAFKMQPKTNIINQDVGLQMEHSYIEQDTLDNINQSFHQMKNYRTPQYTNNNNYHFKKDQLYDLQGIHDGKGAGRNVMVDDKLTRGNLEPRPNDKLNEHVSFIRYVDFLPNKDININKPKSFLMSTTVSAEPQKRFCPTFDVYGVNTRHYNRRSEKYFKNKYARIN
jgi:hypothetical protein